MKRKILKLNVILFALAVFAVGCSVNKEADEPYLANAPEVVVESEATAVESPGEVYTYSYDEWERAYVPREELPEWLIPEIEYCETVGLGFDIPMPFKVFYGMWNGQNYYFLLHWCTGFFDHLYYENGERVVSFTDPVNDPNNFIEALKDWVIIYELRVQEVFGNVVSAE